MEPIAKPIKNENGSIIVIALIILVLLTIAGITATNTSISESYIVRNSAIHKQNLQLAEIAAREGLQKILNLDEPAELTPGSAGADTWLLSFHADPDLTDLDPADYESRNFVTADAVSDISLLQARGETDTLWYYFVGWESAPQSSLVMTDVRWRYGKIVGVYNSPRYGRVAVELGLTKRF